MTEFTNDDRAQAAYNALQSFTDEMFHAESDRDLTTPAVFAQACSDYLADLMHLCDRAGEPDLPQGEMWQSCLGRALMHYREELAEEAEPVEAAPVRLRSV